MSQMSRKEITKKSYDATAEAFTSNVADLAPWESIDRFIKLMPPKPKMIDIGCGSGRDAKIFTDKGVSVTGIDFCPNLLEIAKGKAPLAEFRLMDVEELAFPPGSFDGAWAACSLIHIPKKSFPKVLKKIHSLLKPDGVFYLTVKKGSGEVLESDLRYGDFKKFWSYYEEDELKQPLEAAQFKILECFTVEKRSSYHTHPCLRVFSKKK